MPSASGVAAIGMDLFEYRCDSIVGGKGIFSGQNPSEKEEGLVRKNEGLDQQPNIEYLADTTRSTNTV